MMFDFETLPARDRYKLLVSTVVPRPIAWVVSQDLAGQVNAAPYSFFNAFGDDPAVIAIGCGPRAPGVPKDTLANIRATGQFVVCMVPEAQMHAMVVTATDFPEGTDEMEIAGLTKVASTRVAPPRIGESPVAMECETFQLVEAGRHTIVIGRVLAMYVRDDAVMNVEKSYIDTPKLELVGRMHGSGWYARTTDRVEVPRYTAEQWAAKQAAG